MYLNFETLLTQYEQEEIFNYDKPFPNNLYILKSFRNLKRNRNTPPAIKSVRGERGGKANIKSKTVNI